MSEEYAEHQHIRIMRQLEIIDEMKETIAKHRAALLLISEWKNPYQSFGLDYGSNGERDYFRKIAANALK